jgi:hypothetical protein
LIFFKLYPRKFISINKSDGPTPSNYTLMRVVDSSQIEGQSAIPLDKSTTPQNSLQPVLERFPPRTRLAVLIVLNLSRTFLCSISVFQHQIEGIVIVRDVTYARIAIPRAYQTTTARKFIVAEFAAFTAFGCHRMRLGTYSCIGCSRKYNEESEDGEAHGCCVCFKEQVESEVSNAAAAPLPSSSSYSSRHISYSILA